MDSNSILQFLREQKSFLASQFGVTSIGLFGSFAKGTERADSDVDLLVEMEPVKYRQLLLLEDFLAAKLSRKIQLTCKGKHLRPGFINSIEKYIQYA